MGHELGTVLAMLQDLRLRYGVRLTPHETIFGGAKYKDNITRLGSIIPNQLSIVQPRKQAFGAEASSVVPGPWKPIASWRVRYFK